MQKKIIPILISLMVISLLGIIAIQFKWIENVIDEKQNLIDNNVINAIAKTEEQLNDSRAVRMISDVANIDNTYPDSICLNTFSDINIFSNDTLDQLEVKIISAGNEGEIESNDSIELFLGLKEGISSVFNKIRQESKFLSEIDDKSLSQVINKIDKINFSEILGLNSKDIRLDSANVFKILNREIGVFHNGDIKNWGIYDKFNKEYTIQPQKEGDFDYEISLFTSDILYPNRYKLHLNLESNEKIWEQIWSMILLSILFLLVIISVFFFSIRLVIKHKKISQIKSDFINNMTHEFKTPLASISLAADSIMHPNTVLTRPNIKHYIDLIQAEKQKLNGHVERILEVGALDQDVLEIPLSKENCTDIVLSAIERLNMLIKKRNVTVVFSETTSYFIEVNTKHFENVIVNLIENSIKYSPENPVVKVYLNSENGALSIKIIDEGIGMTKHQIDRAFDHFYRVQRGDLHVTKGFGLGLSYCKLIIEKMHGNIQLFSELKQGTTAEIKIKLI